MLNLSELHVLRPMNRRGVHYGITVNKKGEISLNQRLTETLAGQELEVRISTDGNILVLNPKGEAGVKIPKSGVIVKCKQVLQYLKRREMPVRYAVEWSEEDGLWIGKTARVGSIPVDK